MRVPEPVAAAVKDAGWPSQRARDVGPTASTGEALTVSVAAVVVAEPQRLVMTQS